MYLSLHPIWRKRIIGIIKQLFPKIQFICATYSPFFIIQLLEESELITLEQPLESEYSGVLKGIFRRILWGCYHNIVKKEKNI